MENWETILFIGFIAAIVIQLCYQILFISLLSRKPLLAENGQFVPVSVIVVARNEYQSLPSLIPALLAQKHPKYEIIIVDDRSDDETYDYLLSIKDKYPNLRILRVDYTPEYIHSKKYAITLGIKAAKYEHILLTDADCIPRSDRWIVSMTAPYVLKPDTQFVLGYSGYNRYFTFLNVFIRYETIYTALQYLGFANIGFPFMGVGRNLSYTKSIFLNNKGFHKHQEVVGGDDDLLVNRLAKGRNTQIVWIADGQTITEPKRTWAEWYQQKKRHLSVGKHYSLASKIVIGLLHLSHFLVWILMGILIYFNIFWKYALILFVLRMVVWLIIFAFFAKKIKEKQPLYLFPLLDFVFLVYYFVLGIATLTTKNIQWK
ncbi:MAG: glycosyltransferase [Cytophagales bacterium]|nr:glycosyltransferase [Cytophagales bacterium]MDW8384370.1 glycosyltransferase [Flammeovirgaceae bacterium]